MQPVRLKLTFELMRAYEMLDSVRLKEPKTATDEELELVHDPGYIAKVRELSSAAPAGAGLGWGLGTGDNPVFPDMHEAAATVVGGALVAAGMIMEGELDHAFHMGGGLHHALRARASGFCIYNDPAVAIAWLKACYGVRVLYLDIDAHHGDGVQYAFEEDPDVMTISFHESGRFLFPGAGFTEDVGRGSGRGYSVNLPLAPGSSDDIYLEAFDALVPPLAQAFRPGIILTQDGCDAHWSDPLSHLALTLAGYRRLFQRQHDLAHELTGGRWLALGGGGYQACTVVPRAWTILLGVMAERQLDERLPESWRQLAATYESGPVPDFLSREEEFPAAAPGAYAQARAAARGEIAAIKGSVFKLTGA